MGGEDAFGSETVGHMNRGEQKVRGPSNFLGGGEIFWRHKRAVVQVS